MQCRLPHSFSPVNPNQPLTHYPHIFPFIANHNDIPSICPTSLCKPFPSPTMKKKLSCFSPFCFRQVYFCFLFSILCSCSEVFFLLSSYPSNVEFFMHTAARDPLTDIHMTLPKWNVVKWETVQRLRMKSRPNNSLEPFQKFIRGISFQVGFSLKHLKREYYVSREHNLCKWYFHLQQDLQWIMQLILENRTYQFPVVINHRETSDSAFYQNFQGCCRNNHVSGVNKRMSRW